MSTLHKKIALWLVALPILLSPVIASSYECVQRKNITLNYAIDISSSMAEGTRLATARDFSVALINQLNATGFLQEATSFSFCADIVADNPWMSPSALASVLSGLSVTCAHPDLAAYDGTSLYGAIVLGASVARQKPSSNYRLFVTLTDGEDTTSLATQSDAAAALAGGVIYGQLVYMGSGTHAALNSIAANAGPTVQSRSSTVGSLLSLVDDIVDDTCINFRPEAGFSISDSSLRLGTDGFTITFDGSPSSDVETSDSSLSYSWRLTRPNGSTFTRSGRTVTETFNDDQLTHGTGWSARLIVTDTASPASSSAPSTQSFSVLGSPPSINITGDTVIDALEVISLASSTTTDIDGGDLTFVWDIESAPAGAPIGAQSNYSTADSICIPADCSPTTDAYIGEWQVRLTATDDESDTDNNTVTVVVNNLPPDIDLTGTSSIDIGDNIYIETSIVDDADGGELAFVWASIPVGTYHSDVGLAGAAIDIPTGYTEAGTWVFRLTATDDDGQPDSEVYEEFTVLVDGPVEADITGSDLVGSLSFPTPFLDGSNSEDSDSPCGGPDYCHDTLDGRPVVIENGSSLQYTWYLADVPLEHFGEYPLGRVDEVFGVSGTGPTFSLTSGDLEEGDWVFELKVVDEESNSDTASFMVTVINETSPPIAIVTPTQRFTVDVANVVHEDIVIDGSRSLDLDNLISGDPMPGITDYAWNYVIPPTGCATPALPSGAGATSFTLYSNGDTVPPECQGYWKISLTVTDDDSTPKTSTAETTVIIGNCDTILCIDHPKTLFPAIVDFADDTDILIYYRLDSAAYDDLMFSAGVFTNLAIFHESDLTTPVYTDFDPNVLATDKGGNLVFHWNGYSNAGARPVEGAYSVEIRLFDSSLTLTPVNAVEPDSILIAVAEPVIEPSSETMLRYEDIVAGSDTLQIDYVINGGASFDEFVWRVYDSSSSVIATGTSSGVSPGSVNWDGISSGTSVSPGEYEFELEILRAGASMGVSSRHPFKVYGLDLDVDTNRDAAIDDADETGEENWTKPLGAIFSVNYDRDGGRTAGVLPIPDTIHINDAGVPGNEDFIIDNANDEQDITPLLIHGFGVDLPATYTVFLKAAEQEDIQSIHVFKRIAAGETAIWGALGSRIGGPAVPNEIDITRWVNPASPDFAGVAPSGDATFGIEGLFFRSQGILPVNEFDGEIKLTLELRDGATVIASDAIKMKVAPWIMLPHTESSKEVWTDNYSQNAPLRETASNDAGYFGLDDSTQLHTESGATSGTQWFQDHIEIGYYERPGGPKVNAVFRLPYFRRGAPPPPQPTWPMHRLLKGNTSAPNHDIGAFQIKLDLGADDSGDFGGNLEIMPPTPAYPLGRILIGDTSSTDLVEFFDSQEVQPPVPLPTKWLAVSHIDEVINFTGSGTDVVISDTLGAYAIMNAIPAADRGRHVFFAEGAIPETGVSMAPASANNRIETPGDYTATAGTTWNYIRIYSDAGSGAAGQVARITTGGVGFIEVDKVWNIPKKIIPGSGILPADTYKHYAETEAHNQATWYVNPDAGDKYVLVEATRFWFDRTKPGGHGTPAFITVEEVLADPDLDALNQVDVKNKIDQYKTTMNTAHGGPLTYISVPVIYFGDRFGFDTNRDSVAMTPGLSNFQLVNGTMYFPRQFGPKNPVTGDDLFEAAVLSAIPSAKFTDDWNSYHRLLGEVHCGSNVLRVPYTLDWWSNQP